MQFITLNNKTSKKEVYVRMDSIIAITDSISYENAGLVTLVDGTKIDTAELKEAIMQTIEKPVTRWNRGA